MQTLSALPILNDRWQPMNFTMSALSGELFTLAQRTALTFGRPYTPAARDAARAAVARMRVVLEDLEREVGA